MAYHEIVPHHSNGDAVAVHAIVNVAMESEGESRPSRICLLYWDVHKFLYDGLKTGKIPKMLWEMLQELGYDKQPEYFGAQVIYEGSKPVWHVQVYIFTPKPLRWVYEVKKIHAAIESRRSFNIGICDVARQAYMVTYSHHCQLLDGTEYAHFPQWASGFAYIHAEPIQDEGNFKLKKQVALTATLTKELDSIMEEVEFWQGKYKEAMKTIRKMKRRCPQNWETLSDEETEEFSPHSPPYKMSTCDHLPTSFPMVLKARSSFSFESFCKE
jgi:hypothetical protein